MNNQTTNRPETIYLVISLCGLALGLTTFIIQHSNNNKRKK
jgi:hypothetical protein